jgi:DUF4097 and DUF4098 domain-containing protein YvlB
MRTLLPFRPWRLAGAAVMAAAALAASSACNLQIGTGIEARDAWTRTYVVKPGATLDVRETNGRIHVTPIDGDKIEVSATRIAKGPTEEAAQAALKDFTIAESATADRVELDSTTHGIQLTLRESLRVDYDIRVPRSLNVTIKTTNGAVDVEGIGGVLTVNAVNGRVRATSLGSGADVTSVNGQTALEFATLGEAGVRCKTTNGQIVVTIPSGAKATIAARVVNGLIRTENLAVQETENSRRRLDATVGGGGPEIRLEATNGEIRVVGKK